MSRRPSIEIRELFQTLKSAALLGNGSSFALWRARLSKRCLPVFSSTTSSSSSPPSYPLILWPVTVLWRWFRRASWNTKTWGLPSTIIAVWVRLIRIHTVLLIVNHSVWQTLNGCQHWIQSLFHWWLGTIGMWIIRTFNNTTVNCHNKIPRHDINLGPHLCLNAPCHGKGSGAQSRQSLLKSGFTRSETGNFGHQACNLSILMWPNKFWILDIWDSNWVIWNPMAWLRLVWIWKLISGWLDIPLKLFNLRSLGTIGMVQTFGKIHKLLNAATCLLVNLLD